MNQEAIKTAIRELIIDIAEDMDIDKATITDDALFIDDMGLDSMALLEVLATMEKKFNISIPESEFPNITSITRCAQTVEKYIAQKGT